MSPTNIEAPLDLRHLPKIHTTERATFKRCRRKWDFSSNNRMNLTAKVPSMPLWLGSCVHESLAAYYGEGDDLLETFNNEALATRKETWEYLGHVDPELGDKFDENQTLGQDMLEHYAMWAPTVDDFEVISTEVAFSIPVYYSDGTAAFLYEGRFDGLVKTLDGKYWLLEHKTAARMGPWDFLAWDEQITSYIWAAQQIFNVPVVGAIYNVLRKKIVTRPKPLMRGGFSKVKSADVSYEIYMAELMKHDLNPDDYEEYLLYLQERGNPYFFRQYVPRSQMEVDSMVQALLGEFVDMTRPDLYLYPAPNRDCLWMCDFKGPCVAMNDGSDWQQMLDEGFKPRKERVPTWYERFEE